MSSLHLIRCSPFKQQLASKLALINADDALLLLDDGVYLLNHPLKQDIKAKLYVAKQHCQARALNAPLEVQTIAITEIPALFLAFNNVVTWQ